MEGVVCLQWKFGCYLVYICVCGFGQYVKFVNVFIVVIIQIDEGWDIQCQ